MVYIIIIIFILSPISNVYIAAYTQDLSKNELAHVLLIGGTHNKQGSNDARIRIVVLLTLSLIKSHKYSGAVLLTALCVKSKILKIILS